jgi:hypothetical protein
MKDKKDGKNRGLSITSPLATSTTEKDDLTHRSYYQPPISVTYQSQIDYHHHSTYEMNHNIKQTNYYNPLPPISYDNYYLNSQHHQQQSDSGLSQFI